ncbi:hypothetical protein [Amycolatopsis thermophila]|uniref:Tetratricopeptide (TPR) repeat protein n=1 Tax=Amycolatopsis thermophila TaxID=206084 RepID=A0ABU0EN15_9PSEU|nr:hypothetical protein [Amycolatopsis thermophila]MDQ0376662.1 tetratricopeptide (TPR) repeat protein [Amycolatopsis thermophila]
MVATQHSRSGSRSHDGGRTAEIAAVERLLDQAAEFEVRAPELALVLGERSAALAEAAGAEELWVRGEGLAVSARVRLGLRAPTVGRAVAALRAAEDTGETVLAARLRTDLAVCARSVGAPLTGLAALRPVLDAPRFTGAHKAAALSQLVGCLSQFGRKPELDRTLAEADRLCGADDALDADGRLLARALLRVAVSAHRRRHGDVIGAADAARTGLGFLEQLEDAQHDGGVVRVRLVLQLVCSLLDRGDSANALDLARQVLDEPARAASVAPAGWLRMAIATRVLLPSGSIEAAARMLRDAVHATERHELHALTARLWTELAHVEERLGRYAEAIECLHLARAAEHVHARARRQAVGLLTGEFGGNGHAEVDLDHVLGSVPATEGATSVAVAPLSVPEAKVPVGREPSADAPPVAADAPRPRDAGEPAARGARPGWSRTPEPGDVGEPATPGVKAGWSLAPELGDAREPATARAKPSWALAPEPAQERPEDLTKAPRFSQAVPAAGHRADAAAATSTGAAGVASRSGRRASAVSGSTRTSEIDAGSRTEPPDTSEVKSQRPHDAAARRLDSAGKATPQSEQPDDATRVIPLARTSDASPEQRDEGAATSRRSPASEVEPERRDEAVARRRRASEAPAEPDEPSELESSRTGKTALTSRLEPDAAERDEPAEPGRKHEAATSEADEVGARADVVPPEEPEKSPRRSTDAPSRKEHAESRAARKTRHDSEHGSVAARSVLDRLGISTGAGGGRRRAADAGDPGRPEPGGRRRADEDVPREQGNQAAAESWLSEDAEPVSRAGVAPARPETSSDDKVRGENEPAPSMPVIDNWLPRLRLPPSLAPWDDFADTSSDTSTSTSETPFTNAPVLQDDGLGAPFRSDPSGIPDDDLPEDAGLADLLARALAEHQAGTSSAAALVKRLGNQSSAEPRPVNGHGRNGSEPGNGRHRGDG